MPPPVERVLKPVKPQNNSGRFDTIPTLTLPDRGYCGGTEFLCSVEYDADGNGKPDCCTGENQPVCKGCYEYCKGYCAGWNVGLLSCFGNESTKILCQCAKVLPSCFAPLNPQTTTTVGAGQAPAGSRMTLYLILLSIGFLALVAAVKFANKVG